MNDLSTRAWLALHAAPGVGPATVRALLECFGGIEQVVDAGAGSLRGAGLEAAAIDALRNPDERQLTAALRWLEGQQHHLLRVDTPDWPAALQDVNGAPVLLFAAGDLDLLSMPAIAIVGSRNPTAGGLDNARAFSGHLAAQGFAIVSGLASGIDAAAHKGALAADGGTIAVLGTGPDVCYPRGNQALQAQVEAQGLVISEYRPGTPAHASHFPARNRIISGLSLGTLVVEATQRSGSLITARLAGEQGRAVFAIPGSIHNPMARGCHQLIRQGAQLVEQASDIFAELGPQLRRAAAAEPPAIEAAPQPDPDRQRVIEALGWDPTSIDTLVSRTGLTAAELSSMLLIMELEGTIEQVPGVGFVRCGQGRNTR